MRFPRPRAKRDPAAWRSADDIGLGIHPALARRYRVRGSDDDEESSLPPSVQLSPSLVDEAAQLEPEEVGDEPASPPIALPPAEARGASGGAADTAVEHGEGAGGGGEVGRQPSTLPGLAAAPPRARRAAQDTPVHRRRRERHAPMDDELPRLPGFALLEQVGQGAMGRVYRATDLRTGRVAAVKVLAPELAARADFVARFEREAAAMARVQHPGVVRIVGNGASEDLHYLWMDFVEGGSLRRVLDHGPLPPSRALAFARQIAQGLGAAHAVGVIHRDLKPENILVEPVSEGAGERLVLVDFGLAGITDENEDPHPNLTKSRMTMGTVNYMAPEQRTNAKRVDQRADLYATGVILYELLTGDLPLGRFQLPTERGLRLPAGIDDVVVKSLARAPEERYQSAAEFDQALADIERAIGRAAAMDTLIGAQPPSQSPLADPKGDAPPTSELVRDAAGVGSLPPAERLPPSAVGAHAGEYADAYSEESEASLVGDDLADAPPVAEGAWQRTPTSSSVALPWFRRPESLWLLSGALALVMGLSAGLLVRPKVRTEGPHFLSAPALQVVADDDGVAIAQLGAGAPVPWHAASEGWRLDEAALWFREPDQHAGPSWLRAPSAIDAPFVEAVSQVRVSPDEGGWGAVLLADETGQNAIGAALRADGTCAALRMEAGVVRSERIPCTVTGGSARVALRCAPDERRCSLGFDGQLTGGISAPVRHLATFALGCEATACRFEAP